MDIVCPGKKTTEGAKIMHIFMKSTKGEKDWGGARRIKLLMHIFALNVVFLNPDYFRKYFLARYAGSIVFLSYN